MKHTFTPILAQQALSGTVARGSTVRSFSIPKAGLRPHWQLSVSTTASTNQWRSIGQPQVFRQRFVTIQAGTDRAYLSNLRSFTSHADGFWNGKRAAGYVVTNGVRSRLFDATVTATKVDLASLYSGTNNVVTGTTFESRLETFFRPSVGYWFRVGAINNLGQIGTKSGWVQYTAPSTIGTSTASNLTNGRVLFFDAGTAEITVGETVTGGTSAATAIVRDVVVQSGSWVGNDAAGYLILSSVSGTFQNNEALTSAGGAVTIDGVLLVHSTTASALAAPANVAVAAKTGDTATAEVTWDAVSGAIGYVVDISYQDPTLNVSDEYIDLDTTGLEIPAGAVVFLEWTATTQTDKWTSRVWTASQSELIGLGLPTNTGREWVAYTGGDPAPSGVDAEYFFRRTMTGAGDIGPYPNAGGSVVHSGTFGEFYRVLEVGKTYRARFRMRAQEAVTVTLIIQGVTTGGSTAFNVTTEWQTFEATFTKDALEANITLRFYQLNVSGACVVDIAEGGFFDTALAEADFTSDIKARISSGMIVRDHSLIKPAARTVSMRQALSREGQACRPGTVHSLLRQCQINNCIPWVQLEWHLANEEWLDFIAYLWAPVSSGHEMALLRQSQGQEAPWGEVFEEMWVEFGNEAWNSLSEFWNTNNERFTDTSTLETLTAGQTYGAHCQGIINTMKTSPYWRRFRDKTELYAGGFFLSADFEQGLLAFAPDLDGTGPAGYNGGWETTSAIPEETSGSFSGILQFEGDPTDAVEGITARTARAAAINARGANCSVYEAGPGYQLSGLNNSVLTHAQAVVQEVVMKSRAMGTATLAAFATRAASGFAAENFFIIAGGSTWRSHAYHYQGSGTYMSWALPKMIHDALGACTVRAITLTSPPMDGDVPLLAAWEFKSASDPGSRVIVAVNRDIDPSLLETDDPLYSATPGGTHALTISTGIASCTGLNYYANVGNFRQHNRYPVGFRMLPSNPSSTSGSIAGNPSGTADPLCVAFTYDWVTGSALPDASSVAIDDTYGASAGGLPAGNCVLLHLTGCVDA